MHIQQKERKALRWHRMACRAGIVLMAAVLLAWGAAPALARKGDQRFLLYAGTTRFVAGGDTTSGGAFGFGYGYEFADNLQWDASATFASTQGEATGDDGQTYDIEAVTNEYRTGATVYLPLSRNVVPYAGGGFSLLSYEIDYRYPGSDVGKTSGTGPGGYAHAGIELRFTRNFTVIPQWGFQSHRIQTESGSSETLFSTGFVISLRIST